MAVAAFVSIPEWITKKSLFFPEYGNSWQAFRAPSIYGHPIRLAASLTIGLSIFIYVYRRKAVKIILIAVSLFGIFASLSRSSWLACGVSFLLMAIAVYRKKLTGKKLLYGAIFVIVLLCFLNSAPGKEMISQIVVRFEEATEDSVSRTQRLGAITYIEC